MTCREFLAPFMQFAPARALAEVTGGNNVGDTLRNRLYLQGARLRDVVGGLARVRTRHAPVDCAMGKLEMC